MGCAIGPPRSVDLINQIRTRAGVKPLALGDFTTKTALRDHLLKEWSWEVFSEGKRREDLIRMDKYISSALERKKNARPFQVLYPLPQSEIEVNSNLKQNPGY